MFPFCAFGLVSIPMLLTLKPRTATIGEKLARVDWMGGSIFISSATLFLIAVSWGGVQYTWSSPATLAPLCLGILGLSGTYVWEAYFAKEPFLRRSLFWQLSSVATYFCGAVQGLVVSRDASNLENSFGSNIVVDLWTTILWSILLPLCPRIRSRPHRSLPLSSHVYTSSRLRNRRRPSDASK